MNITVVIEMKNPNALISLAHVSMNSDNPYAAFCEYTKYCLFTNAEECTTISELKKNISNEFGIKMPTNVLIYCLDRLAEKGLVTTSKYTISRNGTYDISAFEEKRDSFRKTETELINSLLDYVRPFGKTWEFNFAREILIKVLYDKGVAHQVFFNEEDDIDLSSIDFESDDDVENDLVEAQAEIPNSDISDDVPLYRDETYVGRFVAKILKENSIYKDYLLKVCEGLMVCVGTYQIPDVGKSCSIPQIKGTAFYFDTRLLLRLVGCAGEAAVEACQELVSMIQNAGGIIQYFPHTLMEMKAALTEAARSLANNDIPLNHEMRLYATSEKVNYNAEILYAKRDNLAMELSSKGIVEKPIGFYDANDRLQFGFDYTDFEQYMISHIDRDVRGVENDALSLWETHMLRRGNYKAYCGTNDKIGVFVTNNKQLSTIVLKYKNDRTSIKNIQAWDYNKSPVITDIRLTCRLWSPSNGSKDVPLILLTENAVAAQRPTPQYIKQLKVSAIKLSEQAPEYASIALSSYLDDRISDAIFEKIHGGNSLDVSILADTLTEMSQLKAKEEEEKTQAALNALDQKTQDFDKQKNAIINDSVNRNTNTMRTTGLLLRMSLGWKSVVALFFVIASSGVAILCENAHFLWLLLISVGFFIAERLISCDAVSRFLINKFLPYCEEHFTNKISKKLLTAEKPYEEEIIRRTLENTDLLKKCKNALNDTK